jgi:hypothetical protein
MRRSGLAVICSSAFLLGQCATVRVETTQPPPCPAEPRAPDHVRITRLADGSGHITALDSLLKWILDVREAGDVCRAAVRHGRGGS